eukprot:scaffold3490_cov347-Prasinococcus_capsulatus_cf.AAC.2
MRGLTTNDAGESDVFIFPVVIPSSLADLSSGAMQLRRLSGAGKNPGEVVSKGPKSWEPSERVKAFTKEQVEEMRTRLNVTVDSKDPGEGWKTAPIESFVDMVSGRHRSGQYCASLVVMFFSCAAAHSSRVCCRLRICTSTSLRTFATRSTRSQRPFRHKVCQWDSWAGISWGAQRQVSRTLCGTAQDLRPRRLRDFDGYSTIWPQPLHEGPLLTLTARKRQDG